MRACFAGLTAVVLSSAAAVADSPPIRITGDNAVPSCVTPDRLMRHLRDRNPDLDPRYARIAEHYRHHGEVWRVRWDYAFFQMTLETNFLTYRRGDGRRGDVMPDQNNFAGLGTTGGGVPGDRFPDVETGVLGQIQHLVAYSGERLVEPVAPRTRLKQDDIISASRRLGRAVTFADLARRWAVDKNYGRSIEFVASRFRSEHCSGADAIAMISPPQARERRTNDVAKAQTSAAAIATPAIRKPVPLPPAASASAPCTVTAASYGGSTTLLIRSETAGTAQFTALTVQSGFEQSMAASFIASYAKGGAAIGSFPSRKAAIARARELCPGA